MDMWQARIENSPALALAREVRKHLEDGQTTSPEDEEFRQRNLRIADVAEWTLTNGDPRLISDAVLNSLISHLQNAKSHVVQWATSGTSDYLRVHAPQELENVLTWLSNIPIRPEVAASQDEIASLRRSVGQHRGAVEREMEQLRAEVATAHKELERLSADTAVKASELASQVAVYRDELTALAAAARDQAIQQQSAFGTAELERQTAFSRSLEDKQDELTEWVADVSSRLAKHLETIRQESSTDLDEIKAVKGDVEVILGIVGEEALTGTYSKNAAKDQKEANRWRLVAFLAAFATLGLGIWLVLSTHGQSDSSWAEFSAKVVLALPLGGVAAYAGRQSSEHRHAQRDAEHVALQLTALGPYLRNLDDPAGRDELLKEIAQRLFGHPRTPVGDQTAELLANNPSLLAQIVSALNGKATA